MNDIPAKGFLRICWFHNSMVKSKRIKREEFYFNHDCYMQRIEPVYKKSIAELVNASRRTPQQREGEG